MSTIKVIFETTPAEVRDHLEQAYGKLKAELKHNWSFRHDISVVLETGLQAFIDKIRFGRSRSGLHDREETDANDETVASDELQQKRIRDLHASLNEEQTNAVKQGLGPYWSLFEGAATVALASSSAHMIKALRSAWWHLVELVPDVGSFVQLFDPVQRASFAKLFEQ